ncbi:MAG: polysaccharide deacetylase family protein [Sphingobacteriaceae bacterium]|nr:polysaccharide deacetylase family protein [Sphingobacteriaceae bacterium]
MFSKLTLQPQKALRLLYPKAVWKVKTTSPVIHLTFDDGPIPGLTEWVLDTLKQYNIKATFFCVGENVEKNKSIFNRIVTEGHAVGNHTYNHIKGFKTKTIDYLTNTEKCEVLTNSKLFRPPYGQLKKSQYRKLLDRGYNIIMWDVISYDYEKIKPEVCLKNVIKNVKNGSIILFHDNVKAEEKIKYALPKTIEHFLKLNYKFAALK